MSKVAILVPQGTFLRNTDQTTAVAAIKIGYRLHSISPFS